MDGADNLDINNTKSIFWYNKMIKEIYTLLYNPPKEKIINFVALRERTYIDIKNQPTQEDTVNFDLNILEIINSPADFKEVLDTRINFSTEKWKKYSHSSFWNIARYCLDNIESKKNYLNHNNIRSFLHNKASLIAQVHYRLNQLDVCEDSAHIKTALKILESRNSFLNGRLFLKSHHDWHIINKEMGINSMNIFYFDHQQFSCTYRWFGLIKTRILQLLIENNILPEKRLIKFLVENLDYPEELVESNIKDLRAFGMIDSHLINNQLCYCITAKGKSYLYDSYLNIDTLYYFALDTPLPYKLVENELINSHDNEYSKKTDYPFACISTVITFGLFLICMNQNEKLIFNQKTTKLKDSGILYTFIELDKFITKRRINIFFENINNLIDKADEASLYKIDLYIKKLESINDWFFHEDE